MNTKSLNHFSKNKGFILSLAIAAAVSYFGSGLAISAVGSYLLDPSKKEYVIEIRDNGFYPSSLVIEKGSKVTFKNSGTIPSWPASNFHPTHEIYIDFDAKKTIMPGDTWSFTFLEAGNWRYHDHLRPSISGTIHVKSSWLESTFGIADPCRDELKRNGDYYLNVRCWLKDIDSAIKQKDIDEAFSVFAKLYNDNSSFASACHDMTHLLGEAAYREYASKKRVVTSEYTTFCSYGFYHGLIEAMLHAGSNHSVVIDYCLDVQRVLSENILGPRVLAHCFHGIGHGSFDTLEQSFWGDEWVMVDKILPICESITSDENLSYSCSKGVFNAVTNAYAFKNYGLEHKLEDPLWLCRIQKSKRARMACYVDLVIYHTHTLRMKIHDALNFSKTIEDQDIMGEVLKGQISEEIQHNSESTDLHTVIAICQAYQNNPRKECFRGIIEGIFISGKPENEYIKALGLCDMKELTPADTEECLRYAMGLIDGSLNRTKRNEVCLLDPKYLKYCPDLQ